MRTEVVKQRAWPTARRLGSIASEDGKPSRPGVAAWPLSPLAIRVRAALQSPLLALLDLVAPVSISGGEVLDEVDMPVLFAANHTSHLDSLVVLKALPAAMRNRVAVAAAADYFFVDRWLGVSMALLFNAFPFCRANTAHRSLEHCAQLLHEGWSVLVYPEGTRSQSGEIGRFKAGVGLLAVKYGVPVVPLHIGGLSRVLPKGRVLPTRGEVTLSVGQPLRFEPYVPYQAAACVIEQAVRSLPRLQGQTYLRLQGEGRDGCI